MAIILTALPLEILTAILLSVPDFTTLLSLILSCRTIHSAFTSSSAVTSRIIGNAYYRSLPALFLPVACNHSYRLRMSGGGGGGAGKVISPAVLNTYIRILATTPIQTEREELTERLYARWESVRRLSLLFSRNRRLPTIEEELIKVDSAVYCLYICANYIHGVESSSSSLSTNMVMMVDVVTEAVVVAKYLPAKYRALCLQLYDYIDANVYRMVSDSRSKAWWSEMGGQFGDWNSDAVIRSLEIGEIVNYIGNLEAWDSVKPVGARAIHARSRSLGGGRSVFGSINGAVSTTTGGRGEITGGDGDSGPTRAASHGGGGGGGESWPKEEPEASEYLLLSLWIRDSLRRHVMRPRGSELVRPLRDVLEKIGESLAE